MKKLILLIIPLIFACGTQKKSVEPVNIERQAFRATDPQVEANTKSIEKLSDAVNFVQNENIRLTKDLSKTQQELSKTEYRLDSLIRFQNPIEYPPAKAFPTAEGYGKNATGGRGGKIILVTNLNNSGTGSFRDALMQKGERTIIFTIGGTITLSSNIYVTESNITILGQTATGDGIAVRGGMIEFDCENIIVRYLRVRPSVSGEYDAINITAWGGKNYEDYIFDHVSLSWATDENFDIRAIGTIKNVTIQNSIISESGYGALAGGNTSYISYYNNLMAFNKERNVRKGYPNGGLDFEMINNIIYGFRYATVPSLGAKFTVLNNIYKPSSQVSYNKGAIVEGTTGGQGTVSNTYAFINGNIYPNDLQKNNSALNPYLKDSPFEYSGIVPVDVSELENKLLNHVGCSFPIRDAVDSRIVSSYISGNGTLRTTGSYPTLKNGELLDNNNNGVNDLWEQANVPEGKSLNDIAPNNYTYIENYANSLIGEY